jgi:hypothetical protein
MKIPGASITAKWVVAGVIVLFLLGVAALAVGGGGSNSSTSTPTSSFDPILSKMEPMLKAEYTSPTANITIYESPKNAGQSVDELRFIMNYPANRTTIGAVISNEGAGQAAAGVNSLSASDISSGGVQGTPTSFGLQAATVALGHVPSTVNDVYVKGTGNNKGIDNEYIQYDSLFVQVMYTITI